MGRLFFEHNKRNIKILDGAWHFVTDAENCGEEQGFAHGLENFMHMTVPSVWNTTSGLLDYEGVSWYEKNFYTGGGTLRFVFGAVLTEAKVYLDGELLGSHYGGFSRFEFIACNVPEGEHRLTVRVDNSFDEKSIPQSYVDWYHYGGITGSVAVETLTGVCVLNNRLEYSLSEDMLSVVCRPKIELYCQDARAADAKITLTVEGRIVSEGTYSVQVGKSAVVSLPEFTLSDIKLWDIGSPKLYTLRYESETDDLVDRVGFRRVEVKNKKFYLNGKETELRGVNRHNEHPDFGFAFPEALMKRDIDLILDAGCNAIRGSHYPNPDYFVDLLDECGVMFWSEIPIWGGGFTEELLGSREVVSGGLEMHREMVKQYYNHPSIVIWGMHNEINSYSEEAYKMSKLYYEFLKEAGGDRAVVYASCYPDKDICFEFCDIIALNKYIGWYRRDEKWDIYLNDTKKRAEAMGFGDKPIIMGEFGGAAIFGFHDQPCVVWSEEYQAKILAEALETFRADENVVGYFVWQFADIRTNIDLSLNRARSFNNKGILNEYRKPKLGYYTVQKIYKRFEEENN